MFRHLRNTFSFKRRFPSCQISSDLRLEGPISNLILGKNVEIQHNVFFHLGGHKWCNFQGKISIGDNSIISPGAMIYGSGEGGVTIGKNFKCGPGIKIFASYEDFTKDFKHTFDPVKIEDNVMLYTDVIVHSGVRIGENSVVAANSVVTKDVPSNVFVAGNPAKIKRKL